MRELERGTALVTGASAGLGAAFAHALAAQGHDLILTARRGDRLEALAAELRAAHGVKVTAIAGDLTAPEGPARLVAEIARGGLSVNLLVNNAGFGLHGAFVAQPRADLLRMVTLNCAALVELTHLLLPGMIQMRRGAILNVASTAAFQPGPWMAVYYASKAFVLSFSEALHSEVRRSGVRVTALCPGPTRTEFGTISGMAESRLFRLAAGDPDKVVRDGLAALAANRALCVSGLGNRLMAASTRFAPRAMLRSIVGMLQATRRA